MNLRFVIGLICIILIEILPLHAENKTDLKSLEWQPIVLITGISVLAYQWDQPINNNIVKNPIGQVGYFIGNPITLTSLAGAGYVYGWMTHNDQLQSFSQLGLESLIYTQIVVESIKILAKRSRPRITDSSTVWNGFNSDGKIFDDDKESFPSSHSACAFAFATVIADHYRQNEWIVYGSYSTATAIAVSRLYAKDHWLSDVIIGSTIGFFVAKEVVFLKSQSGITFVPSISSDGFAISCGITF